MPNVVGRQLDIALQDIKLAGFSGEVDVAGGGMLGIIDKSNWKVCTQTPEAGKAVTKTPHVSVDRACGADAPSSTATSSVTAADDNATQADPAESAEPTVSETPELKPLTRATSADFKHLLKLTDQCSSEIAAFASKYEGRDLAFDGSIVAMNNHDAYKTRYDILVNAGDFSATKAIPGPNFQFRDVNVTYDLKLTGPNIPDTIGVGQNLRVVAKVDTFITNQCLFLLDPVSTQLR
jgi:hypothetical protein